MKQKEILVGVIFIVMILSSMFYVSAFDITSIQKACTGIGISGSLFKLDFASKFSDTCKGLLPSAISKLTEKFKSGTAQASEDGTLSSFSGLNGEFEKETKIGSTTLAKGSKVSGGTYNGGSFSADSLTTDSWKIGSCELKGAMTNVKQDSSGTTGVAGEGMEINGVKISSGESFKLNSEGKLTELKPSTSGTTDIGELQKNGMIADGAKVGTGNVKINGVDYNLKGEIAYQNGNWVTTSGTQSINGWSNLQSGKTIGLGKNYDFTSDSLTVRDASAYNSVLDKSISAEAGSSAKITYSGNQVLSGEYNGNNAGLYSGKNTNTENILDGNVNGIAQRSPNLANSVSDSYTSTNIGITNPQKTTCSSGSCVFDKLDTGKSAKSLPQTIKDYAKKAVGVAENVAEKPKSLLDNPQQLMESLKGLFGGGGGGKDSGSSGGSSSSSEEETEDTTSSGGTTYSDTTSSENFICTNSAECEKGQICSFGKCIASTSTA